MQPRLSHPSKRPPAEKKQGFAVLIALSLMSFVLVIVLSLILMASVEIANAANAKDRLLARENARLGLMIALGDLQRYAGPDQRVTARAEILGTLDPQTDADGKRFWTGVWDSTSSGSTPIWLVSGRNPDLTTPVDTRIIGGETVNEESVGEANSQNYVSVPSQNFDGGSISWWVSDEGVKASVKEQTSERPVDLESAIPLLQIPQRYGFEEWMPDAFVQSQFSSEFGRLLNLESLPLLLGETNGNELQKRYFHDLTTVSSALLVDTQNAGLRENLNTPISSDPNDPFLNGDLDGFANSDRNFRNFDIGGIFGNLTVLDGEENRLPQNWRETYPTVGPDEFRAYHHLTPILTEFAIYFAVFQRSGRPSLRFYVDAELYNPYSFPILLRSDNDARALTILVDGLPELKVDRFDEDGAVTSSGWVEMDGLSMFASNARETGSWLTISTNPRSPYRGNAYLMPGETYRLEDPDPRFQPQGLLQSLASTPQNVLNNERVLIEGRAPGGADQGALNVRLVYGNGGDGSRRPNDPPAFEVLGIPYEGDPDLFRFNLPRADGRPSSGRGNPGPKAYVQGQGFSGDVDVLDSYIFAFHFRLGGDPNISDLNDFLNGYDLRNPSLRYDSTFTVTDTDGTIRERNISDFIYTAGGTPMIPTQVENEISDVFPGPSLDLFNDRATRLQEPEPQNSNQRYTDLRLYDVPLNGPMTVADYRHAHFVNQSPFVLSSPGGGELNRAFDRFFVAKPDPASPETLSKENPWIVPATDFEGDPLELFGPNASALLRIDGAFNVNSTSIDAWRSLLSQSTTGAAGFWSQPINSRNPRFLSLERYFSRLPSGALQLTPGLTEDLIGDTSTPDGRRESLRHGYRTLTSDEGPDQLHQLAYHIVDQLKEQGRPFRSLAEFVNSGILQTAIDRVGPALSEPEIPSVPPLNENRIGYEPTTLRQTDLIAHLAPLMTARSDTFRIHVKADALSQLGGQAIASSSLEAVVQRRNVLPANLPPGTTPSLSDYERQFEIISLSWTEN